MAEIEVKYITKDSFFIAMWIVLTDKKCSPEQAFQYGLDLDTWLYGRTNESICNVEEFVRMANAIPRR